MHGSAKPETLATDALRFGWVLAEVRGRYWPDGPRPVSTPLPAQPANVLPLRSQRSGADARREAVESLVALATRIELGNAEAFASGLLAALAPFDEPTADTPTAHDWTALAAFLHQWDARIQNELTRRDEQLTNAYLLGRGMAESYWGLGPDDAWSSGGQVTGVALPFLLGADRRNELTRMLGRYGPHLRHEMTGPALAGSLEAWGAVAEDDEWSRAPELRATLYEQVRRWYQLLVLDQDPTTMIRPGARLLNARRLRTSAPQMLTALVLLGIAGTLGWILSTQGVSWPKILAPIFTAGGVGVVVLTTITARARGMAQQLATRYRQDAYTDLVAICVSVVPPSPAGDHGAGLRSTGRTVEAAVRRRLLTPPTPAP